MPSNCEYPSWSLGEWNTKSSASARWKKYYFNFLLLSALLHTLGSIIILPPIFNFISHGIPVWDVYLWLLIGSSILFLGGSLMEFGLETMYSWSILIKLTAPFCLASSLYYVYGALSLGELVEHSFSGNLISLIACCVLLVVRFIRILIMTKMQWINGLILSNNSELKLQGLLFLVGVLEGGGSGLFIAFSYWYYFYWYAAGLLMGASVLRLQVALTFYSECILRRSIPAQQQSRSISMEDISSDIAQAA